MKRKVKKILITGGLGFIGSNFIKVALDNDIQIMNLDSLTYASNKKVNKIFFKKKNYSFKKIDITSYKKVETALLNFSPDVVVHMAAETHVDNSIIHPRIFINTNIIGTYNLLQASKVFFNTMVNRNFLFHHISTDEVYGSLDRKGLFDETSAYKPNSPYSASKASSDHLVRAWGKTFGLPYLITNCSNNYGPYQNDEKLIPKIINCCIKKTSIPIFGDGKNVRDWIYVTDHIKTLLMLIKSARPFETYTIGGSNEISNLNLVHLICNIFDKLYPNTKKSRELIKFVKDRKGHDFRYAISNKKLMKKFKNLPKKNFKLGIKETIKFYVNNYNF
jgi:dTDP-glucose 4,6-dehydratase